MLSPRPLALPYSETATTYISRHPKTAVLCASDDAIPSRPRKTSYRLKSGLENSRRDEKEAALEEVRRVLRQDTSMYEARAFASNNMLHRMRTLEAGNM